MTDHEYPKLERAYALPGVGKPERIKHDLDAPLARTVTAQRESRAMRAVTEAERIRKGLDRYLAQVRRDRGDLSDAQRRRVLAEIARMREVLAAIDQAAV